MLERRVLVHTVKALPKSTRQICSMRRHQYGIWYQKRDEDAYRYTRDWSREVNNAYVGIAHIEGSKQC